MVFQWLQVLDFESDTEVNHFGHNVYFPWENKTLNQNTNKTIVFIYLLLSLHTLLELTPADP